MEMSENLRIMHAIRDGLRQVEQPQPDTNAKWNRAVLSKLWEIGHQFSCGVGARGGRFGADWGEWVYDVTWIRCNEERHHDHLVDVPLVAEVEWSGRFSNVKDDFHKLLLARAGVRLMIYPYYALGGLIHGKEPKDHDARKKAARKVAEQLAKSVNAFKCRQENDAWLLVGGVWHADDWFRSFTIRNGQVVDFP